METLPCPNPFYVVPDRIVEVTPAPNSFGAVEVAVMVGAEVSGRVVFEGRGLGGVRLVLRDLGRDRAVRLLTFTDGGFYAIGVAPGSYELTLANGLPPGVRASARAVRFAVPAGGEPKRVENLELVLERSN
jgi:hypothetical protein